MRVAEGVGVGGMVGRGVRVAVLAKTGRGVTEGSPPITIGRDNNAAVEDGVIVGVKDKDAVASTALVFVGRAEMVGIPLLGRLHPFRVSKNTIKNEAG